jgi:hypothetical protein
MGNLKQCMGLVFGVAFCLASHADTLRAATIAGQVQQFLKDGRVTGCGVTFSAIEVGNSPRDLLTVFNGSFMLSGPFGGLMKGWASSITGANVLAGNYGPDHLKPSKTLMVWAKAQGADATTIVPGQSIGKSDDPGYIMYLTPIKPLMALVDAIYEGTPVQMGMRTSAQKFDVVLFGKVAMPDEDKAALSNCITEWVAYVSERYADPKSGADASQAP